MNRQEQIDQAWFFKACQSTHCYDEKSFKEAVEWADNHPDKNKVYTKQELRDMGFGFDLNGNIVTLQEIEERSKKYIKYRKDKWVEKTCEWLETIAEYIGHDSETLKESFKKYINGCD